MNFSDVNAVTIKGKAVKQIDLRGKTVWRAPTAQSDFVQLTYIESDGASYIDTGVSPTDRMTIVVNYQIPDSAKINSVGQQYVYGTFHRKNSAVNSRLQFVYGGNNIVVSGASFTTLFGLGQGGFDKGYTAKNLVLTTNEHSAMTVTSSKRVSIDNNLEVFAASQNTFNYPMPIFLFACNDAQDDVSRPVNYSNGLRITSCRMRVGGVLVRDMVPGYLRSTGQTGMMDLANNNFYPNAGSGAFVRGAVVPDEPVTLKVMTYNVGQWFNGTGVMVPAEYDDRYYALQDGIFQNNDVDAAMLCEYKADFSEKPRTAASVLSPYLPHSVVQEYGAYYGRAIYSKYALSGFQHTYYSNDSNRYISESSIEVGGKRISLIVTHLTVNSREARQTQLAELKAYLQSLEYFICCGDFNTDEQYTEDFDGMRAASYHLVNHNGAFFRTHHGTLDGSGGAPLDNIICSPNIDILSAYVDTSKFNNAVGRVDHIPLIATVKIT